MLSSAMHGALQQLLHASGASSFTSTEPGFMAADVMPLEPQTPEKAGDPWPTGTPEVSQQRLSTALALKDGKE